MVKVASCFSQVLSMVNRNPFERAVRRLGAERGAKGFSCWNPFVAMDWGYVDYALFGRWTEQGAFFVTHAKQGMAYDIVEARPVPEGVNILSDTVIRLTSAQPQRDGPSLLRRIVVWDAENARRIELLTNHLDFAASTLAVKTQIWTALITMLLLRMLQLQSTWNWSLSNLAAMLRLNLLTYRDLRAWLDAPYQTPVIEPEPGQLALFPV